MAKPLKIGFVIDDGLDSPDGVQQYVLTLGRWLSNRGHEIHYLTGETKRTDTDNIHSMSRNFRVSFNANRLSSPLPASKRKIKKLLHKERFDVLHVQVPYSPFMAAKIVSAAHVDTSVVGTFHILPYGKLQRTALHLLGLWLWRNSRRFDRMFAVSEPAAELCAKAFRIRAEVLPNAVDIKPMRPSQKVKKTSKKQKIVFMGRLVERKGCLQLIKALHRLQVMNMVESEYVVEIGGDGPERHAIKKLISKYELQKRVHLKGFIDEKSKPAFLAEADIAIFPSLGGESFGIVLIEAMAAGSGVVVGGDNPGYRSVLSGTPECLVDPRNPSALAELLARLLSDSDLRIKLHGRQQKIVNQFDVSKVGIKLEKVYENLSKNRV